MKGVAFLWMMFVAALMAPPNAGAQAQPQNRWTDPEGIWSLDFAANDWVIPENVSTLLPDRTLVIVPRVAPADGEGVTACSAIQAHPHIDPGVDIAHFADSLDAHTAAGLLRRPAAGVTALTHTTIGDVSVADVLFEDKDGRDLYRMFLAPSGADGLLVILDCTRTAGANPDNVAAQDRILASLQINQRTAQ
jgi:hypothetical protein